jgi:hypothetical protein
LLPWPLTTGKPLRLGTRCPRPLGPASLPSRSDFLGPLPVALGHQRPPPFAHPGIARLLWSRVLWVTLARTEMFPPGLSGSGSREIVHQTD